MLTIDSENRKQIRTPFEIHAGLSGRVQGADLQFTSSWGAATDTNISDALDNENWNMRTLTDLQGDGFPADGSCSLYDPALAGSLANGKVGARSVIGGTITINVVRTTEIDAVTLAITSDCEGTVEANGITYAARRIVVIPIHDRVTVVHARSLDPDRRIEIASITPGVTIELNTENIISCTLALRSDLSIIGPSWQVSDIEISAYWPDDISEAVSNIGDDVPIWYYSGYPGDYSEVRTFYLSEPASMENGVITFKGEDMSHKLEDKNNIAQVLNTTGGNGRAGLYNRFVKYITDAGVKLVSKEAAPASNTNTTAYTLILKEQTSREATADIMNLAHYGSYWPTFVDAGIPRVYHSKPAKKWDIYEDDCGDVVRTVDRNIAKIFTSDEDGLHSKCTRNTKVQTLQTRAVTAGKGYSHDPEGYWWYLSVTNAKSVLATAAKIVWTAAKTTTSKKVKVKTGKKYKSGKNKGKPIYKTVTQKVNQCVVTGKSVTLSKETSSILHSGKRPGQSAEVTPAALGKVYGGTTLLYPNYNYLFNRSNITGSFTFRGDPRMQPRDVFCFHRKDGTEELCTIESITLIHEAGGTKAELTYRKGIC